MVKYGLAEGLRNKKTLEVSQQLDIYLMELQKRKYLK